MPAVKRVARVIMNKQHMLFHEQQLALNDMFTSYEVILVPQEGWSREHMDVMVAELLTLPGDIVFLSPIPYMLLRLCKMHLEDKEVYLFHRDIRSKALDLNGKGNAPWQLVK